ncbi:MAG TPA: hypothetical protein VIF43_03970 [Patescibacteria group bacterium]
MTRRKIVSTFFLLAVIGGGLLYADYQSKAMERRDAERRAAVTALKRTLDSRSTLPARDGTLKARATGGLAELGTAPKRPEDTTINYAVSLDARTYFVCTALERGGALYATRQGTFDGPTESCRPDADPVAVGYVLDAKLTSAGARAFLRADPAFVSKGFIQEKCAATADDGQLQGCFTGDRIYLIDLPDETIRPEVSVTAAHETLHAAWEGLASEEREHLTRLLENLARKRPDLQREADSYDEESRINELHSIAGTEIKDVGKELERHYAEFLSDRGLIVKRHLDYEKVIDGLEAEIERLKDELTALEARGQALLDSGDIDAYNAFVAEYNSRAPGMVAEINAKVDRFNRLTEHTRPDGRVAPASAR